MKKVSIIIPVYNVKEYLAKCVNSVIHQTYNNLEILVVDDGSTDGSDEICDSFLKKDNRIKIFHKKNAGLSDARNFGIDNATGSFLFFLDSDDYLAEDAIEILVKYLTEESCDIVICNRYHFYDTGKLFVKFKQNYTKKIMNNVEAIFEMNNFELFDMSATCKLYRKELFDSIRFPVGKISEDFYIMYKILDSSKKIMSISNPLYYYYQREGSISKTSKLNTDFINAALEQCLFVEKKYPELQICVRSAYVSANMTSYNMVISSRGKVDVSILKKMRENVKENFKYMKQNKKISKVKKIQTYLFIYFLPVYNFVYKIYKKYECK